MIWDQHFQTQDSLGVYQETASSYSRCTPPSSIRPSSHVGFLYVMSALACTMSTHGPLDTSTTDSPSSHTHTVPGRIMARS
jgi:hypothetical protein